jgi:hypothetical protein
VRRISKIAGALLVCFILAACSSATPKSSGVGRSKPLRTREKSAPTAEVVDGVPLVPITSSQHADCVKYADQLKQPVPCPGLLPDPIPVSPKSSASSCLGELGEGACGPAVFQLTNPFLISQSNFQVPRGYVGVTFEQYNGRCCVGRSPLEHSGEGDCADWVFCVRWVPFPA